MTIFLEIFVTNIALVLARHLTRDSNVKSDYLFATGCIDGVRVGVPQHCTTIQWLGWPEVVSHEECGSFQVPELLKLQVSVHKCDQHPPLIYIASPRHSDI